MPLFFWSYSVTPALNSLNLATTVSFTTRSNLLFTNHITFGYIQMFMKLTYMAPHQAPITCPQTPMNAYVSRNARTFRLSVMALLRK